MEEFEEQAQAWTEFNPRPVEQFHPKDQEIVIRIDETLKAIGEAALPPLATVRARFRHPNRNTKKS